MITVTFACGHRREIPAEHEHAPVCLTCRETRVSSVTAPQPRFRGVCLGPYAQRTALAAVPCSVAPAGGLFKE